MTENHRDPAIGASLCRYVLASLQDAGSNYGLTHKGGRGLEKRIGRERCIEVTERTIAEFRAAMDRSM